MDCETCKKERAQETGPVPRWTHEADMARMERTNSRQTAVIICLSALCAVLAVLFYVMNVKFTAAIRANNDKWLEMWSEYDFESYEYQQDGAGVNIIGNTNGVEYYGAEGQSAPPD